MTDSALTTYDISLLAGNPLFSSIDVLELKQILGCFNVFKKEYERDETIWHEGDSTHHFGIIISGSVTVSREDFWGNREIIAHIEAGGLFGESAVIAASQKTGTPLPVNAAAADKTSVVFIDYSRILRPCTHVCAHHTKIFENLMIILAKKNGMLLEKLGHLAKRTTREKLLSYLSGLDRTAKQKNCGGDGQTMTIPLNRQELADYLGVDRSALSKEMGLMKQEGIIDFDRNIFKLKRLTK